MLSAAFIILFRMTKESMNADFYLLSWKDILQQL